MLRSRKSQPDVRHAVLKAGTRATRKRVSIVEGPIDVAPARHPRPRPVEAAAALAGTFPVVAGLVGEAAFTRLAGGFLSQSATINTSELRFTMGFPAYLASASAPVGAAYLPDVARLEWGIAKANEAPDFASLPAAALMRVRDDHFSRLTFTMSPSSHTVASRFPSTASGAPQGRPAARRISFYPSRTPSVCWSIAPRRERSACAGCRRRNSPSCGACVPAGPLAKPKPTLPLSKSDSTPGGCCSTSSMRASLPISASVRT